MKPIRDGPVLGMYRLDKPGWLQFERISTLILKRVGPQAPPDTPRHRSGPEALTDVDRAFRCAWPNVQPAAKSNGRSSRQALQLWP